MDEICRKETVSKMTLRNQVPRMLAILILPLVVVESARSQQFTFQGQLSGWTLFSGGSSAPWKTYVGLRYLPEFSLKTPITEKIVLDFDASFSLYGSARLYSLTGAEASAKGRPYRLWARLFSEQFELRLGLQKINFGSASLLRPLMWFDRIDPRDPLQITDGVYGLLFRYYFLKNTNVWLWALAGNTETRGWEAFPTAKNNTEFGGRIQVPVPRGEIGFTYHHRRMDLTRGAAAMVLSAGGLVPEDRFGLDGKWDIGIGLWFEGTLIHQKSEFLPFSYQRALNVGLDYTFGLGNGLHVMGEHFLLDSSREILGAGQGLKFTAVSLNYPLGLLDNLSAIFYYDWKNDQFYRFINWQRKYDRWTFYLIGFWNPETFRIYQSRDRENFFAGKGIQFMVVFNH